MIDLNKKISSRKSLISLALLTGLIPAIWGVIYSLQSYKTICAGVSTTEPANIDAAIVVAASYLPLFILCLVFYKKKPTSKTPVVTSTQLVVAALVLTIGVSFIVGGLSRLSQPLACSQGLTF